jgi:hypothetical protein
MRAVIVGHHISAVVFRGPYDEQRATEYDMKPIRLTAELTLFPLDARFTDHWAEKLSVTGLVAESPLLNSRVIHHMVNTLAADPLFAVIETDFTGGIGSQAAAVYRGAVEVMPPESTEIGPVGRSKGPINIALRLLGVVAIGEHDEFESVGLDRHRDFYDLFEAYE